MSELSDKMPLRFLQWLVFSILVGSGFGWMAVVPSWTLANQLASEGQKVIGVVDRSTRGDFFNAPSISYRFVLGGKERYGSSPVASELIDSHPSGSQVEILYLSSDPAKSGIDPVAITNSAKKNLFIALIMELFVAMFFWGDIVFSKLVSGRVDLPSGKVLVGLAVTLFMLAAGLSMLFFAGIPKYQKMRELVAHAKPFEAQVTAVYDNSDSGGRHADYSYVVDGREFNGEMPYSGGYGDRPKVFVSYLPSDPSVSALRPPDELKNAQFGILFMIFWNACVVGFMFLILKSRNQQRTDPS